MLRIAGSGIGSGAGKAGDAGMLSERVESVAAEGADEVSGLLVGVSPVNAVTGPVKGSAEGAAQHLGLLHVLVVDDDEAVRKACVQIASGMGFAVVLGADSATAARGILKHQRIDLLLLDLKLPGGGGLPLLEQ